MILKASQRGGAKQLGLHLLRTDENEHVELHEIRGFLQLAGHQQQCGGQYFLAAAPGHEVRTMPSNYITVQSDFRQYRAV
jgi:hypothetical protein